MPGTVRADAVAASRGPWRQRRAQHGSWLSPSADPARQLAVNDWGMCRYLLLITYDASGERAVDVVAFAQHGDLLYAPTVAAAGAVARTRANPSVLIAPASFRGKPRGPAIGAHARALTAAEAAAVDGTLCERYGAARRVRRRHLLGDEASTYLEIRTLHTLAEPAPPAAIA